MLKKKEHLSEEKREKLRRYILHQLRRQYPKEKPWNRYNCNETAVNVEDSAIRIETEEDEDREEEENGMDDRKVDWWTVANFHLLRLPKP